MLKQVLKQARGDRRPDIRIGVGSPFPCEPPDLIRVCLDMLGDFDDRLPARVQLAPGGFIAWENPLRFPYGVGECHIVSQHCGSVVPWQWLSIANPSAVPASTGGRSL